MTNATTQRLQVFTGDHVIVLAMSGRRVFIDCPEHGAGLPATALHLGMTVIVREVAADKTWTAPCAICGTPSTGRLIAMRSAKPGRGRPACSAACLAGKRSCDCQCGGLCHGAGTCQCNTATTRPVVTHHHHAHA